jgi:hypothetical protein
MLAHFGRQRDVRTFHSVALQSCLRHLQVNDLREVEFLIGVALRSRPTALPQLFSAWVRQNPTSCIETLRQIRSLPQNKAEIPA